MRRGTITVGYGVFIGLTSSSPATVRSTSAPSRAVTPVTPTLLGQMKSSISVYASPLPWKTSTRSLLARGISTKKVFSLDSFGFARSCKDAIPYPGNANSETACTIRSRVGYKG